MSFIEETIIVVFCFILKVTTTRKANFTSISREHQVQEMWRWLSKLSVACLVAIVILIAIFSKARFIWTN